MKKLKQLIYAAALLCSMAGCNSDPLPKPTQDGNNTFGCMIDGKPWVPDGGTGFMPAKPIGGGFYRILTTPTKVGIWIQTLSKDGQKIHLHLNSFEQKKYELNQNTQTKPTTIFAKDYGFYQNQNQNYVTSSTSKGSITITKADTITGILSGIFEFNVISSAGVLVAITNGRFDIKSPQ
jgi:Family of unknown function (DUF6252)